MLEFHLTSIIMSKIYKPFWRHVNKSSLLPSEVPKSRGSPRKVRGHTQKVQNDPKVLEVIE